SAPRRTWPVGRGGARGPSPVRELRYLRRIGRPDGRWPAGAHGPRPTGASARVSAEPGTGAGRTGGGGLRPRRLVARGGGRARTRDVLSGGLRREPAH